MSTENLDYTKQKVFEAIQTNNLELFEQMLSLIPDVNCKVNDKYIINHICYKPSHLSVVMLDKLISAGGYINLVDDNGENPLLTALDGDAFSVNTPDIINYFLEKGVEVNRVNNDHNSALAKVAYLGIFILEESYIEEEIDAILKIIQSLINYNGQIELLSLSQQQELIETVIFCDTEEAVVLLEHILGKFRLDLNHQNDDDETALISTITNTNNFTLEFVSILLKNGANPNILDERDKNALGYTVACPNPKTVEILKLLFDFGACPVYDDGSTVLENALENTNCDILIGVLEILFNRREIKSRHIKEFLFKALPSTNDLIYSVFELALKTKKINLNFTLGGISMLEKALTDINDFSGKLVSIVELLLSSGANPNQSSTGCLITKLLQEANKRTPLIDVIKLLLDYNANTTHLQNCINNINPDGETFLTKYIKYNHSPVLNFLFRLGANPNIPNGRNFYPIEYAVIYLNNNTLNTLRLLKSVHVNFNPADNKCVILTTLTNYLHRDRLQPVHVNQTLITDILHFVISNGSKINFLIRNINKPLDYGDTFLTKCVKIKDIHTAKFLLSYGADINQSNQTPLQTPLAIAVDINDNNMIDFLISNGANPYKTIDEDGNNIFNNSQAKDFITNTYRLKNKFEINLKAYKRIMQAIKFDATSSYLRSDKILQRLIWLHSKSIIGLLNIADKYIHLIPDNTEIKLLGDILNSLANMLLEIQQKLGKSTVLTHTAYVISNLESDNDYNPTCYELSSKPPMLWTDNKSINCHPLFYTLKKYCEVNHSYLKKISEIIKNDMCSSSEEILQFNSIRSIMLDPILSNSTKTHAIEIIKQHIMKEVIFYTFKSCYIELNNLNEILKLVDRNNLQAYNRILFGFSKLTMLFGEKFDKATCLLRQSACFLGNNEARRILQNFDYENTSFKRSIEDNNSSTKNCKRRLE